MAIDSTTHLGEGTTCTAKSSYPLVTALTAVRKAQQMTQSDLAERAGLSRMTVQRLESNGLDPRLSTLQEMARVLEQEIVLIPTDLHDAFAHWLRLQQHVQPTPFDR